MSRPTWKELIGDFLRVIGAEEKRQQTLLIKTEKAVLTRMLWLMDERLDEEQKEALEKLSSDKSIGEEELLKRISGALRNVFSEKEIRESLEKASAEVFIGMVKSALPKCTDEQKEKLRKLFVGYFPELKERSAES